MFSSFYANDQFEEIVDILREERPGLTNDGASVTARAIVDALGKEEGLRARLYDGTDTVYVFYP